ncbi:hypothetical protein [Shewanella woodyi]|uniref:Porin domain-containing protein n=1 Tax=Shewanella woodyi (strain ATCC 51908 / MS32) TaxID=392500 RepID=B1KH65_SHEWM|nr:hypothetical protein [Shewanella woodyi]ACA88377.1 conserved hypothetical protein [Shewanella woodyi ATCC 51908]
MNIKSYIAKVWLARGWILSLSLALSLTSIHSLQAEESEFDLTFSGFGTLGVVHNSSDALKFHSELTVKPASNTYSFNADSLIGLQLNARLPKRFDAVAQVVIKDRISSEAIDSLELLFLRYRPSRNWALRVGRTSSDLYMLSEYRNVGYAYLWARPITEFYELSTSIAKIDGVDVSYVANLGDGVWENKLAYGRSHSVLSANANQFEIDLKNVVVFSSIFTQAPWLFRLAITDAEVDEVDFVTQNLVEGLRALPPQLWPDAASISNVLDGPKKGIQYYALGLQYDSDRWVVQSEFSLTESDWGIVPPYYTGYLSVGYRFDNLTFYSVASYLNNVDDPISFKSPQVPTQLLPPEVVGQINGLYQGSQFAVNAVRGEQRTYSLGVRWDLYPNTSLKFQWDHTKVDMAGNVLWTKPNSMPQLQDENINLFSLNFSFIFSL